MELEFKDNKIIFSKEPTKLDNLAIQFSKILSYFNVKHIFLSGYIPILFGRNRASEDIDVVCGKISKEVFDKLWIEIHRDFDCIITDDVDNAYNNYLLKKTAIRFAYKGEFIPNIELKFVKTDLHKTALENPIIVELNEYKIPISPLEQQIAYKLYMTSEKDIEDARFLFKLFEEHLNKEKLIEYINILKIDLQTAKGYLGWSD
ncbi:MAG: hypothetical protein JSV49_12015 [Thermoplasmata archaeon]|nr:MAG: hypothetical protein JSV49_12015 [Thermoplasmata archaeon]